MITRAVAGEAVRHASGKGTVGLLASLATQATLVALDTPDTRSWETLPARIAVWRMRVPAGHHSVRLDARGFVRTDEFDLKPGGFKVVSVMGLR